MVCVQPSYVEEHPETTLKAQKRHFLIELRTIKKTPFYFITILGHVQVKKKYFNSSNKFLKKDMVLNTFGSIYCD